MTLKLCFWYGGTSWIYSGQVWVWRSHSGKRLICHLNVLFVKAINQVRDINLVKVIPRSSQLVSVWLPFGWWEVGLRLKDILVYLFQIHVDIDINFQYSFRDCYSFDEVFPTSARGWYVACVSDRRICFHTDSVVNSNNNTRNTWKVISLMWILLWHLLPA